MSRKILFLSFLPFVACQTYAPDKPAPQTPVTIDQVQVPAGFKLNQLTTQELAITLTGSDGQPFEGGIVRLLDDQGGLIERRGTDANGSASFKAAAAHGSWKLSIEAAGFPNDTLVVPSTTSKLSLTPDSWSTTKAAGRTMAYSLPSTYGSQGLPNSSQLDITQRAAVTTAFLSEITYAFPEGQSTLTLHPEYFQQGNPNEIKLTKASDVYMVFLTEGAGYTNTLGYYSYTGNVLPAASDLNKVVVFPNVSLNGSGGKLVSGDRVKLGTFPAGTRIGMFIISNGWNGTRVDTTQPTYYTNPILNPEATLAERTHAATLYHLGTQRLVTGFEDINRSSGSGSDNDFNDVIVALSASVAAAFDTVQIARVPAKTDSDGDGAMDNADEYPNDASRAYTRYFPSATDRGVLAWEDQWPANGDNDFNDLVTQYRIIEDRDAKLRTVRMRLQLWPMAAGASIHSGFGISLGKIGVAIDSAVLLRGGTNLGSGFATVESGETILRLSNDLLALFPDPSGVMINTSLTRSYFTGTMLEAAIRLKTPYDLAEPPYNPFLYRTTQPGWEIHMADQVPTTSFQRSLLRSQDDASDSTKGLWFRNARGLPWAINVSSDWQWPVETVGISTAYPGFANWVLTAGTQSRDWATKPTSSSMVYPKK